MFGISEKCLGDIHGKVERALSGYTKDGLEGRGPGMSNRGDIRYIGDCVIYGDGFNRSLALRGGDVLWGRPSIWILIVWR